MPIWQQLLSVRKKIESTVARGLTLFGLCATYLVGIGVTSIVGKLTQKRFLSRNTTSTWQPVNYAHSKPTQMF